MLSLFTSLINKLQSAMTSEVPRVFEAVFKCTLDMITKNFEDFPEHRANLFNLLRAINHHCFPALLTDQSNFTLIIESIKWAFKHTERNVAETGPWFHDGSVESLEDAIVLMARHQLNRRFNADQERALVAFLHALTMEDVPPWAYEDWETP